MRQAAAVDGGQGGGTVVTQGKVRTEHDRVRGSELLSQPGTLDFARPYYIRVALSDDGDVRIYAAQVERPEGDG
jgi:hypothetical protein